MNRIRNYITKMSKYVDNERLVREIEEHKQALLTNPDARLPEYVGKCILDIARNFSKRPNFYGYSYREEMVGDAIENCLKRITNFDSSISTNAFSYITQICFFAFIRRIATEKKQSYVKHKMISEMPVDAFDTNDFDDAEMGQQYVAYLQAHNAFDGSAFEAKPRAKKVVPRTALEEMMEDDE